MFEDQKQNMPKKKIVGITIAAIGVVFGDIGTSPLYTMKEAFSVKYGIFPEPDNVLGILSLIAWGLLLIVTLKYVFFMLKANNRGEGGMMALLALVLRATKRNSKKRGILMVLGLFGAALFYGDGVITPAISVLSAVEGLQIAAPELKNFVIPITLIVVVGLFLIQSRGTASVGALFGPITVIWFGVLGILGIINICDNPMVLEAFNPIYGINFFVANKLAGFITLGAIVLAITGTEGIYTDMGHFGSKPIRIAWVFWVLPSLLLNYFGQGALILANENALLHPFFSMVPTWAIYPVIVLATLATVIASQAVISGTYSLTKQAIQLGYCPRLSILHTSEDEIGQIYLPWVNWALFFGVIALILGFKSSSNLAGAYGIAITGMMTIDTILVFFVVTSLWKWSVWIAGPMLCIFLVIDLALFGANSIKLINGGWFPILIALVLFTCLSTWQRGRSILNRRMAPGAIGVTSFLDSIREHPPKRVEGIAIFLTGSTEGIPPALLHNLNHNKVMHQKVILLTVKTKDIPHISNENRIELVALTSGFYRLRMFYGFKDSPDIPAALELVDKRTLDLNPMRTSYFLSRQTLVPRFGDGMYLWRERLFALMSRNGGSATAFFKIPANRVIELGSRVEF